MSARLLTWTLTAALSAAGGFLAAAQDAPQPPPPAGAVAHLNLDRCIQDFAPFRAQLDQLRGEFDTVVREFQERQKQLTEIEGELAAMERGSDAYVEKAYALEREKYLYERDNKFQSDRLNAQRIELFLKAYPRIEAAAAAVAERHGFSGLLTLPPPLTASDVQGDPVGAFEKLQQRTLLWANPDYDVTGLVLEELRKNP